MIKGLNASLSLCAKSFAVATALWAVLRAILTVDRAVATEQRALRAPFVTAAVRMRRQYHVLSRDAALPVSCGSVKSREILPGALPTVASKADLTRYCTESNLLLRR